MAGSPPRGWAWGAIVALFLLMTMGNIVSATGSGLGCPDFWLCSGSLLPHHWESAVHWVHRWLGVALLGHFIHLAVAARRTALASTGAGGSEATAPAMARGAVRESQG